ncbi:hypothetical protein ACFQ6C_26540 [Streptomyces sp. NPDC056454]|uniref:hypothetical protein n=1 Tax=Streptomyces sp. NPDC056454 TaxID=3345823 RepID=UPI0036C4A958
MNSQLVPVDTSSFQESMTFWAADASIDVALNEGRDRSSKARVAVAPSLANGDADGPVWVCDLRITHWSTPQTELLACLVAHVLAREDGEGSPVIFTDFQAAERLLDSILGLRPMKRPETFQPLPQLALLMEALGEELDYVHLHWLPRRSTPALALADKAACRRNQQSEKLVFEDLLSAADRLRKLVAS